jgi:hypothetical protein
MNRKNLILTIAILAALFTGVIGAAAQTGSGQPARSAPGHWLTYWATSPTQAAPRLLINRLYWK